MIEMNMLYGFCINGIYVSGKGYNCTTTQHFT